MNFTLTSTEIISVIQSAICNNDGLFTIRIPAEKLHKKHIECALLVFSESTHTVNCGKISARFSPTQFSLLQYIYNNGKVGFEDLQDNVWKRPAGDGAIRGSISKLNSRLLDCGFPIELVAHHSRVSIESI